MTKTGKRALWVLLGLVGLYIIFSIVVYISQEKMTVRDAISLDEEKIQSVSLRTVGGEVYTLETPEQIAAVLPQLMELELVRMVQPKDRQLQITQDFIILTDEANNSRMVALEHNRIHGFRITMFDAMMSIYYNVQDAEGYQALVEQIKQAAQKT